MNKAKIKIVTRIIIIGLVIGLILFQRDLSNSLTTIKATSKVPPTVVSTSNNPTINSENAILVSLDNNEILYEKNINQKTSIASLTKIMTIIIAVEHYQDYQQKLIVNQDTLTKLTSENAVVAGFVGDETVSILDLLYGAMLSSGADATLTLANDIAGSEAAFIDLMNEKCQELNMTNTHFDSAVGFDSKDNYSTVKDLSQLLTYALNNPIFNKLFTSKTYQTSKSKAHPDGIFLQSTMFTNLDLDPLNNGEILGGKTGYTTDAGLCLASLAKINGKNYIFITTKADGNHQSEQYNLDDAINIYNSITN